MGGHENPTKRTFVDTHLHFVSLKKKKKKKRDLDAQNIQRY